MTKISLLLAFLISTIGATAAAEPAAPARGFLVFSSTGVANYALDEQGGLQLRGKSSTGEIDEFLAVDGRIYRLHMLLGKVAELGADLQPVSEGPVKSQTGIPQWLGVWDGGLLVLNDNAVLYLDRALHEVARIALAPRANDQIVPVLDPLDFDVWQRRGYLLANTGELYVLPLDLPRSAEPLGASWRSEDGMSVQGQWIDPEAQTLNLIGNTHIEEHDPRLKAGEWRVIKQQVVLSQGLKDLGAPARRTVVHEEREIHQSRSIRLDDGERPGGVIYERLPPYRAEGPDRGTHIGVLSRTTPAYAEAFAEPGEAVLPRRAIVRLRSEGRYEVMDLVRAATGRALGFDAAGGRRYVESDLQERVLRLQPEPYGALTALPELQDVYFKTLAY